jgi:hypothetical protein
VVGFLVLTAGFKIHLTFFTSGTPGPLAPLTIVRDRSLQDIKIMVRPSYLTLCSFLISSMSNAPNCITEENEESVSEMLSAKHDLT